MRDAQSKLDQVIAFTGKTIGVEDVSTVLGLVGRDLLLEAIDAVANEDAAAAFETAGRAVELGYDLRLVCRELARVVRDLLVLSVDPARIQDPEIAGEGERDRLKALAARFSREDLLRAFDLLAKAESDIKAAAQPRYHLEMALLRWIYLRKLTPIEDLIAGRARAAAAAPARARAQAADANRRPREPVSAPAAESRRRPSSGPDQPTPSLTRRQPAQRAAPAPAGALKDALLAEIRKSKGVFYSTVVAQAQRIDVIPGTVTFAFSANQGALRAMFEQNRAWLESVAEKLAGRKVAVESTQTSAGAAAPAESDRRWRAGKAAAGSAAGRRTARTGKPS